MCCKTVIGLVLGLAGVAAAQEPGGFPGERMVTVTAGVGNAMGWFGVRTAMGGKLVEVMPG